MKTHKISPLSALLSRLYLAIGLACERLAMRAAGAARRHGAPGAVLRSEHASEADRGKIATLDRIMLAACRLPRPLEMAELSALRAEVTRLRAAAVPVGLLSDRVAEIICRTEPALDTLIGHESDPVERAELAALRRDCAGLLADHRAACLEMIPLPGSCPECGEGFDLFLDGSEGCPNGCDLS